uniref:protein S100-G-like n=1 Tax=Epinephelus lanceolatus TaxID=310571 RepID=UPI0014481743|nr:protein S100-G-like [Epinephelus lanceolatus]
MSGYDDAPKLLASIYLLKDVFDQYAGQGGDSQTLTKKDLSELLRKELRLNVSNCPEAEEYFNRLDANGDGTVDFEEYLTLVGGLALILSAMYNQQ